MEVLKLIVLSFVLLCCYTHVSNGQNCLQRNETSGKITYNANIFYNRKEESCWTIRVPQDSYVKLNLSEFNSGGLACDKMKLTIKVNATKQLDLCQQDVNRSNIISIQDTRITIYAYQNLYHYKTVTFGLSFTVESLACRHSNSFRCSNFSCIPRSKVCDGFEDCKNGADEKGCDEYESGFNYHQLRKHIAKGISWLKSKRNADFGWTDNTHRAVIALYLTEAANFNGSNLQDELTAKQLEFELAISLLRNSTDGISPNRLSLFINALLGICRDPHHFRGYDLIKIMTNNMKNSQLVHPGVYLAICNSNGTLPNDVRSQLLDIFKKDIDIPYLVDTKAMAIMAASCIKERSRLAARNFFNRTSINDDKTFNNAYNSTIKQLQDLQKPDGSFGNVYTTALISQAMVSAGKKYRSESVIPAAVKYLLKELNKTSVDFLTIYWSLPVLMNRSLTDLSKVNCLNSSRKEKEVDVSVIRDKLGQKVRVQYSLYIGDDNDITHTIYLRVAKNSSAYEIMQLAQSVDSKYKFETEKRYGKLLIYKIGNYTNDPENGKFWSFYYKAKSGDNLLLKTIDDFVLNDGDHMVMWFRTTAI